MDTGGDKKSEPCFFIFSWVRHKETCTKIAPVPFILPGTLSRIPRIKSGYYEVRVVGPNNEVNQEWTDALSATCLGSSVELVWICDSLVLRSREKITRGSVVTFICPLYAPAIGLNQGTRIVSNPGHCEKPCLHCSQDHTTSEFGLGRGGAQFVSCNKYFARVTVEWICDSSLTIQAYRSTDDGDTTMEMEMLAECPFVVLRSVLAIPAGMSIVAECSRVVPCDAINEMSSSQAPVSPKSVVSDPLTAENEPRLKKRKLGGSNPMPKPTSPDKDSEMSSATKARKKSTSRCANTTSSRVRNVCATEKKWVVSIYSPTWYEWPTFPLSTKHICQSNRVSEPLARTYALQFTISCFRFTEHCSGVTDFREKILRLERPADHMVLPGTRGALSLPPRASVSDWEQTSNPLECDKVLTLDVSPEDLALLFPISNTDWRALRNDNIIDMVTVQSATTTTHGPAPYEYIVVIICGSAVANWTTRELYKKMIRDRAYT